jgi:hypothetical protein
MVDMAAESVQEIEAIVTHPRPPPERPAEGITYPQAKGVTYTRKQPFGRDTI